MANSPQVDYYISQILDLQKLLAAIDGVQPIIISIGNYKLKVDPVQFPAAYKAGSDVLTSVSLGAINDYKVAISEDIVTQAQTSASANSGTVDAEQPATGSTTSPSDSTVTSNQPTTPATNEVASGPSSSSTTTSETTT